MPGNADLSLFAREALVLPGADASYAAVAVVFFESTSLVLLKNYFLCVVDFECRVAGDKRACGWLYVSSLAEASMPSAYPVLIFFKPLA